MKQCRCELQRDLMFMNGLSSPIPTLRRGTDSIEQASYEHDRRQQADEHPG